MIVELDNNGVRMTYPTQADREAAIAFCDKIGRIRADLHGAAIRAGEWDHTDEVQAFSAHRLAEQERCAKVAEEIGDECDRCVQHANDEGNSFAADWQTAGHVRAYEIARAIRGGGE